MNILKEKINADFMSAFKNKETEKKNFLGILKTSIINGEKKLVRELTDNEIVDLLLKHEKNSLEVFEKSDKIETKEEAKRELEIIKSYLPKKMSESEIKETIQDVIYSGAKSIKEIMDAFKDKQVDRKLVSSIANESLKSIA